MPPAAKKAQAKFDADAATERDAAQVAAQDDPEDVAADDSGMCKIHFPRGWDSPAASNHVTKEPYPAVTCEHGNYVRPVKGDDSKPAEKQADTGPAEWRVLDPRGEVVLSGDVVHTALVNAGLIGTESSDAKE
jgi:hypothetical protein